MPWEIYGLQSLVRHPSGGVVLLTQFDGSILIAYLPSASSEWKMLTIARWYNAEDFRLGFLVPDSVLRCRYINGTFVMTYRRKV